MRNESGPIPCVVFALEREARYFQRFWHVGPQIKNANCRACYAIRASRSMLFLQTGLGSQAMLDGLSWAVQLPLSFVLLAGFSGGLVPELQVGDLVVASEMTDTMGHCWPATAEFNPLPNGIRGRLLTTAGLIGDPKDKTDLASRYQAVTVDMESAVAAQFCHTANVPFACLRVVSDDVTMRIPGEVISLLKEGRASVARLTMALLRKPSLIGHLWRLGKQTDLAARKLAEGLNLLLN